MGDDLTKRIIEHNPITLFRPTGLITDIQLMYLFPSKNECGGGNIEPVTDVFYVSPDVQELRNNPLSYTEDNLDVFTVAIVRSSTRFRGGKHKVVRFVNFLKKPAGKEVEWDEEVIPLLGGKVHGFAREFVERNVLPISKTYKWTDKIDNQIYESLGDGLPIKQYWIKACD